MSERNESWVVYLLTLHGKATGRSAVCEQGEWEELQRACPGDHILVRSNITTETEA